MVCVLATDRAFVGCVGDGSCQLLILFDPNDIE